MIATIIIAVFISVALLTGALLYPVLTRREVVRSRVEKLSAPRASFRPTLLPTESRWIKTLGELGRKLKLRAEDLKKYRESLSTSGFRIDSVHAFLGLKLFLAILLPVIFFFLYAGPQGNAFSTLTLLILIICAISGYLLPTFWLDYRAKQRKIEIFHTLPDVLDLLTVCVEAGLSLDAALIKTVDNFQKKSNPLIEEIKLVTLEIRTGRVRSEALKGLAERTMVDDVRAFVAMLLQTEKFGTSLGKTLRTYSDSQRIKRKQIAEERAAKVATKLLIPLVFFIFPGLFVVIMAPALISISAGLK